jgi:hypothetical protein
MNRIGDTVTERIEVLNQCGALETYNGPKQYRTRIILECFIITFDNTSLLKKEIKCGLSMLDYAEELTKDYEKNSNGNEWRNILDFTYKYNNWNARQQKIFVDDLCNYISKFDDIEQHLDDFVEQDITFITKQHIIPSCDDLETENIPNTTSIPSKTSRASTPSRTPTLDHYNNVYNVCQNNSKNDSSQSSKVNILVPRKKNTSC